MHLIGHSRLGLCDSECLAKLILCLKTLLHFKHLKSLSSFLITSMLKLFKFLLLTRYLVIFDLVFMACLQPFSVAIKLWLNNLTFTLETQMLIRMSHSSPIKFLVLPRLLLIWFLWATSFCLVCSTCNLSWPRSNSDWRICWKLWRRKCCSQCRTPRRQSTSCQKPK